MTTHKVKYIHLRNYSPPFPNSKNPLPLGGATIAYVVNGTTVNFAVAECHKKDHFNKRLGRAKAGGRLKSPLLMSTLVTKYEMNNSEVVTLLINEYHREKEARGIDVRYYRR